MKITKIELRIMSKNIKISIWNIYLIIYKSEKEKYELFTIGRTIYHLLVYNRLDIIEKTNSE